MPTLTQSQSIILGKVLERSIAPMLSSLGLKYSFSEAYADLLTRPDYLIYQGEEIVAALAVTCTQDNQTMNKKRWRYIDEVFQIKSFFGPDVLTLNCEFGDPSAYMQSEMNLANAFFDASLLVHDYTGGKAYLEKAISLVLCSTNDSESICHLLVNSPEWAIVEAEVVDQLQIILQSRETLTRKSVFRNIWENEHRVFAKDYEKALSMEFPSRESYLRYCVLGGLIAGEACMKELLSSGCERPLSDNAVQGCQRAGFTVKKKINGTFLNDSKVTSTITAGLSYPVYHEIEDKLLAYKPVQFVVRDIQNPSVVDKMVNEAISALQDERYLRTALFGAFRDDCYCGIEHDRTWLLDIVLIYLDVSTNYLNRLFIQQFGRKVIATKMEHYISKTDCGRLLFADDAFLSEFCSNLASLVFTVATTQTLITDKHEIAKRYVEKKIYTLGNQPFVNPMHRYVEAVLSDNHIAYEKTSIQSALNGVDGIPSTMSSIREIYQICLAGKTYWIKAIAGYDGVKDKTREMAARGHLLQYDSPSSHKREVAMVFVTDGNWSVDLQRLLYLSGWKTIIPVFEFDSFIKEKLRT